MKDCLILRLDAPLISFGAPVVDQRGFVQRFPALSQLTGLLGNALGYDHRDAEALSALQRRIRYACRWDRRGIRITDYQTVDLGQDFMRGVGWTTRGRIEGRKGGGANIGTHVRFREFHADGLHTVAVTLDPSDAEPTVDTLAGALARPARTLFVGRKPCLPSRPILDGRRHASSVLEALRATPLTADREVVGSNEGVPTWWPADLGGDDEAELVPVTDERDWQNQLHVGQRYMRHGLLRPVEEEVADGC